MNVLFGLLSVAALSVFLGWFLKRPAALMPLVAIAAAMLFFTVAGCAGQTGFLVPAGYAWYALCAGLFVVALVKTKGKLGAVITPAFWCFLAGSVLLVLIFGATRPLLTQWDEFTFWGPAAKVTSGAHQLYTTAHSSLIARSYPPGLIVYSYMMQFFGGFTEYGYIACYGILYLAGFAAAASVWGKNKSASVVFFGALVVLPLLFEFNLGAGQVMRAYITCLADMPMAVFFGGALCLYFAGGEKGARLMLPVGLVLAALTNLKDMGLALALCAWAVLLLDLLFCERERLGFWRLRRGWALLASGAAVLVMIVGSYLLWFAHLSLGAGINRFELGATGQPDTLTMLVSGVQMLFGAGRSPQFSQALADMGRALFTERVFLFGSGVVVLALILAVSIAAFVLSTKGRQRRRVAVFTLGMALGFAAFYIFNIFTYAFIFKPAEAAILREYNRYIAPYWIGWLMGSLVLLARAATTHKASFYRLRMGRAVCAVVCAGLVAGVMLRGNWQANFLNMSPSVYSARLNLNAVAATAATQGEKADDLVYIVSQGDDGARFYMYGFQLTAVRGFVFNGPRYSEAGTPMLDEAGQPLWQGNAAATLVDPKKPEGDRGPFDISCTPAELEAYLRQEGFTHLLLDVVDGYFIDTFAPLFADGLEGWDTLLGRGHTYYRVEWGPNGHCTLVPEGGEGP